MTLSKKCKSSEEYIEKCVKACDGLPNNALDGGWTAKGIIAYAKKLENLAEQIIKSSEDYMTEVDDCWDLGDELTESMLDKLKDKHRALQSAIYEFRKIKAKEKQN